MNSLQAQPRGVPDLDLPNRLRQGKDRAAHEPDAKTGAEGSMGIPATALDAYKKAERTLSGARPMCHLPWQLVAGIGRVESVHASGYGLRTDGSTAKPIRGPRLDGEQFALIRDTDGGRWDGDAEFDRAIGPMQFIPSTWATRGADGNGDGVKDPNNIYDAALATGHYLCAGGRDLNRLADLDKAILSYNYSREYVNAVRDWMGAYQGGKVTATSDDAPAIPHRPDPAETGALATRKPPRTAEAGATAHTQAQREQLADRSPTPCCSKPVLPQPANKPVKKPASAPDPHANADHRTVTRLERIGDESLGERTVDEAFARRPQVQALDAHGHPVAGTKVSYLITETGTAHFANHVTSMTVSTDGRGIATGPVVWAGDRTGRVVLTAVIPGKQSPAATTFTGTVRQAPASTADRLELLTPKLVWADVNSRFLDLLQVRATASTRPTPGIHLTATLLNSADEQKQAQESTYGPYFKNEHGAPVRTLVLLPTDSAGRLNLPQLFTDERSGNYTLRLVTPEGVTLDIPLTVRETATD
ncbi:lytic transglycosylase domain-containing protein [Streptomyces noursei]|uniref:lytic transglycosylase domain-containing protein n=1 Tax=Streptomyces noursei TaxID=1971 RepID=UPI0033D997BD